MQLRRWQGECLPIALQSLADNRWGVIQAVTGAGKAILLAKIAEALLLADPDQYIVVTTPTVDLVEQLGKTIRSVIGDDLTGLFYTRKKQHDRKVVVCCNPSVPALAEINRQRGRRVAVWLADEVHSTQARADDYQTEEEGLAALDPLRRLGLTATPFLAGAKKLSLFKEVVYRLTPAEAIRDKIIVPWRVVGCDGWATDSVTDDGFEINTACVRLILDHTEGPGVVDADNIKDAEEFTEILNQRGIRAEALHSKTKDCDAVMERLGAGELRAVVHVNKLTTGSDYPFLRWGCLRREVGSKVRFIQQVGRFVRVAPGKTEALLLDPHGLFDRFRLTYEAALGFDPPPPPPTIEEILEAESLSIRNATTPEQKYAAQTAALGRYVRELYQALAIEGVEMPKRKVASGPWRKEPVSDTQVAGLARMLPATRRIPVDHGLAVKRIVSVPDLVTKGIGGDLRDTLTVLAKRADPFVPAIPIAVPPDGAFAPPVIRTLHVAVVLSKTHTAATILRGRTVVWEKVRERRTVPDDTGPPDNFMDLCRRTFDYAVLKRVPTDAEIVGSHPGAVVQAIRRHPRVEMRTVGEKENPAVARCWKLIGGLRGKEKAVAGAAERAARDNATRKNHLLGGTEPTA